MVLPISDSMVNRRISVKQNHILSNTYINVNHPFAERPASKPAYHGNQPTNYSSTRLMILTKMSWAREILGRKAFRALTVTFVVDTLKGTIVIVILAP